MPVGGVVGNPVDQHPQPPLVGVGQQEVEVVQGAEDGVDVAVVGHVVAEVGHGRGEEGRDPDGVHPEPLQVVQMPAYPFEVTDAIAVGVSERTRVDLVDDG